MSREYPDRPIVGIGGVVWRGDRVLLIRRGKAPRLGQWSLPGGGQNLGETLLEGLTREVREETGLEIEAVELLAVVDLVDQDETGRVRYHYTLVDFMAEALPGEPEPGDDASEVAWFTQAEAAALGLWSETDRIIALAAEKRCLKQAGGR